MKNKEKVASIPDGRSAIQRGLDRLSEVGLFSLEERMLKEILSVCINIWCKGVKKMELDSSQGKDSERMESNGALLKIQQSPFKHMEQNVNVKATKHCDRLSRKAPSSKITQLDIDLSNLL